MSFNLERESDDRNVQIDSVNDGINDISFKRTNEDYFNSELKNDYDSEIEFISNENKRVNPKAESEYEESVIASSSGEGNSEEEEEAQSYEEIQQQKAYYLSQLKRLQSKGFVPQRYFGMEHSLSDIKGEVMRMKKEIEVNRGISYCKQALMFCVSSMEMFNNRYDPFGIDLDGWSTVMMQNQNSYDDVFERLYEKYHTKISVAPEVELIFMVGGSAAMFAYQKQLTKSFMPPPSPKMRGPSVDTDELLKQLSDDSDVSSVVSDDSDIKINIPPPKKRGRKPKAK